MVIRRLDGQADLHQRCLAENVSFFCSTWPLLFVQADVCGFWSFPRLSPNYRPPEALARFLATCEVERKPVFVVGLGSMPELGLVKVRRLVIIWFYFFPLI